MADYSTTLVTEDEDNLDNATTRDLLEAISYGEDERCVNCGRIGNMAVLKFHFGGKVYLVE